MAADTEHDPRCAEERALLEGFLELDTPQGYRAEFIEGEIVVSPPPIGDHEYAFSIITTQVIRKAGVDMDISGHKGLELARGKRCTSNFVIPDGVFAPSELKIFRGAESWMPPDGVAMVFEVTSGKPDRDRKVKRYCYAKAGIPLYLLVDRTERTVSLFSEPDPPEEDYLEDVRVIFGKPIELPDPFGFSLETADFH
ncbi:Uma2 family endonuclease [Actinomadura viridis]|uniref:Uma2 family endonuclease n=1 Tax=Actinomadura viridis TaxID=58110 RepID=A0A931DHE3_9ACTN|nr:Uma2 family endonuclease [Actinomadura viridis]MBG6086783.1 Uma2 family endonuclease [Actinomadura viridis]